MTNPLLTPSSLPYNLPDWSAIKPEHILPAAREAMKAQREAWEAIATNPEPATVENTVEAVDAALDIMHQVFAPAYTLMSSIGGEELDKIQAEIGPEMSAHQNLFNLDKRIYNRYLALDLSEADEETTHLVEETIKNFRQRGIDLSEEDQETLKKLDAELSGLEIEFGQKVVAAMSDNELVVEDVEDLDGVDASSWKNEDGTYNVPLANFTNQPYLADLTNPDTRAKLLEASMSRGLGSHATSDTREIVTKIASLRAQRGALLGHPHFAQGVAEEGMAKSTQAVLDLLTSVAGPAIAGVEREKEGLLELAKADGRDDFTASDWQYYESKKRGEVSVDDAALKPYLLLENVVEKGIFYAANKLFGITFTPREDLAGYVDSVKTWEVKDEDGSEIGLFQADFFSRKGKRGGAWMNPLVSQSRRAGHKPVIMNNCNFPEPAEGQPCLLTWDNVETVFHEFGHALHGLLSDTHYVQVSGTSVARDFVELPSQLNEMWAFNPEVMANYAVHYETGEALPAELAEKLASSKTFGQGFATTEFLAAALLDQAWHTITAEEVPSPEDVEAFEKAALEKFDIFHELVPPRYRSAYFNHTFGGGYEAGYYSYMWAEVLVADIEQWFTNDMNKGDGGLNREAGDILRTELLSRGSARDNMESFKAVRGREPRSEALLERRGL